VTFKPQPRFAKVAEINHRTSAPCRVSPGRPPPTTVFRRPPPNEMLDVISLVIGSDRSLTLIAAA
jgi:hypothetical protein